MKKSRFLTSAGALVAASGLALTATHARTWTSAEDASKTFEGELLGMTGDSVRVKMEDGRVLTFPVDKLSGADREFITESAEALAKLEALRTAPVPTELDRKLVKLNESGKRLARYDMEAERGIPEYYLFYYSASW